MGYRNIPNICQLFHKFTQVAPKISTHPSCFTLPDQVEAAKVFITAIEGIVGWKQISFKETILTKGSTTGHKVGRILYHIKIWKVFCPWAGYPLEVLVETTTKKTPNYSHCLVKTTVNKDSSIEISSKNIKVLQTATTTVKSATKTTILEMEIIGEPLIQPVATPICTCGPSIKFE